MKKSYLFLVPSILVSCISMANPAIDCYKNSIGALFNRNNEGIAAAVQLCSGATSNASIDCYKNSIGALFNRNNEGVAAAVQLCSGATSNGSKFFSS